MLVSKIVMPIDITQQAPESMSELWAKSISDKADLINQRRLTRIPDEETFLNRLADSAEQKYRGYPNPAFLSRNGLTADDIATNQGANLKRSFEKYDESWRYMFETVDGVPAKRYKDKVARSKTAYGKGVAARTLPFTGFKDEGRGPVSIAGLWLTGDQTVLRDLRSGDRVEAGGPYLIGFPEDRSSFKAMLIGRLIQAGATILKAHLADTVIAAHNTRTNHLVQSLINPGLGLTPFATGGLSHVDFTKENKHLFLEIQVDQI
jgi:hypothetical protein